MAPHEERFGTPRSAIGFALAMALAVFTFWLAGLFAGPHSHNIQASAADHVVAISCMEAEDATRCTPPPIDP